MAPAAGGVSGMADSEFTEHPIPLVGKCMSESLLTRNLGPPRPDVEE
jgi:hypothetical protein